MRKEWIRNSIIFTCICIFICFILWYVFVNDSPEPIKDIKPSTSAIHAFNTPELLAKNLSDNGIGRLEPWKAYEEGVYLASSNYFQIGEPGKNGISNQLCYYAMGNRKEYITSVEIILIVNNKDEINKALILFGEVALETFKDIAVPIPTGLLESLSKPQNFIYDSPGLHIKLFQKWNGLTEWHLAIADHKINL